MRKPVFIVTTHVSKPCIVKSDIICVKSVLTSSSHNVYKGRLKYLVEHNEIELVNAHFEDGELIITEPYKTFKANMESQVNDVLKEELDNFDVLSERQKELSKYFPQSFELDIKRTSASDKVYSKPVHTKNGYTVRIVVDFVLASLSDPIMSADVYVSNRTMDEYNINFVAITPENLEKLLAMISNLPGGIVFDERWDDVLIGFLSPQPNWYQFKVLDFEKLQNICSMLNITDEFFEYLRRRIDRVAKHPKLINQYIDLIEKQYGYSMAFSECTVFLALHMEPPIVSFEDKDLIEHTIRIEQIYGKYGKQYRGLKFDWEPLICTLNS